MSQNIPFLNKLKKEILKNKNFIDLSPELHKDWVLMQRSFVMKQLVYDLPTRVFHWILAILFLGAFIIAKTIDEDSVVFTYHMMAGLTLSFMVILRVIWGLIGTKHARFFGFALNPKDLVEYFKGILAGSKKKWAGHNPASSWAALAMMGCIFGLGFTGFNMVYGPNKENFEDAHEVLSTLMILLVIAHVVGIIIHTVRHKEMIALSMVDGQKEGVDESEKIASSRPVAGVIFLAIVLAYGINLVKNYNTQTQTLNFFGTQIHLGEAEEKDKKEEGSAQKGDIEKESEHNEGREGEKDHD